ncbi:hypothetical protein D4Q76_02065 [archaeon]|nr:MAG: hypothetical protein D4Q76_02065 [archaeon]
MIYSELLKKLENSFIEFRNSLKENEKFNSKILYYYELALENIKNNNQEVAVVLLCTIIETLAKKKDNLKHIEFYDWIVNKEILEKFSEEFKSDDKKAVICKYKEMYLNDYGATRKFVNIILDTYKVLGGVPDYIANWKTEMINGIKTSMPRKMEEQNEDVLKKDFEKDIKQIYSEYRSKFIHEGKFIPFDARINTLTGGTSQPQSISIQQIAGIVLQVIKHNLQQQANATETPRQKA